MSRTLTTVATFQLQAQAELARNALADAGIPAVVADGEVIAMDWLLANAVGGVKVQVRSEDADRAAAVLDGALGAEAGLAAEGIDEEELARQALEGGPESETAEELPALAPEPLAERVPPPPPAAERDDYARRLFLSAVFGLIVPPLFFYCFYLLLNAAFGPGPLSPRGRRHLTIGAALTLVPLLLGCLLATPLGWMLQSLFSP
jgi:hypothetical protein